MVGVLGPSRVGDRASFCQGGILQPFGAWGGWAWARQNWLYQVLELRDTGDTSEWVKGFLLELSWQGWHFANFAQRGSEHMVSGKTYLPH